VIASGTHFSTPEHAENVATAAEECAATLAVPNCTKRREFDIEALREFLRYQPETGRLFWRERDARWFKSANHHSGWNKKHANREVTCVSGSGYLVVHIFRTRFFAHRVIWAISNDAWPEQIDHIDGNPRNNKLSNLRSVTCAENMRNKARYRHNKCGHYGILHLPKKGTTPERWLAVVNRKKLGRFFSLEEALAARDAAILAAGFHPNHGRTPLNPALPQSVVAA